MIFDTLPYLPQYLPLDVWQVLEPFLIRLRPDMPDGEYAVQESDIFARISSYQTKPLHEGRFEAHKRYVDLQILLTGSEIIDVTPCNDLMPDTEYDEQNDIHFYKTVAVPAVRLMMVPNSFALLFPQDLHCPQRTPHAGVQEVKKVVVKINRRHWKPT